MCLWEDFFVFVLFGFSQLHKSASLSFAIPGKFYVFSLLLILVNVLKFTDSFLCHSILLLSHSVRF